MLRRLEELKNVLVPDSTNEERLLGEHPKMHRGTEVCGQFSLFLSFAENSSR